MVWKHLSIVKRKTTCFNPKLNSYIYGFKDIIFSHRKLLLLCKKLLFLHEELLDIYQFVSNDGNKLLFGTELFFNHAHLLLYIAYPRNFKAPVFWNSVTQFQYFCIVIVVSF